MVLTGNQTTDLVFTRCSTSRPGLLSVVLVILYCLYSTVILYCLFYCLYSTVILYCYTLLSILYCYILLLYSTVILYCYTLLSILYCLYSTVYTLLLYSTVYSTVYTLLSILYCYTLLLYSTVYTLLLYSTVILYCYTLLVILYLLYSTCYTLLLYSTVILYCYTLLFILQDDAAGDPEWSFEDVVSAEMVMGGKKITADDVEMMSQTSVCVFEILEKAWASIDCALIDMKIEFGVNSQGWFVGHTCEEHRLKIRKLKQ